MAYKNLICELSERELDTKDVSYLLNLSCECTRRKLAGINDFTLTEAKTLSCYLGIPFETLFSEVMA